MTYVQFLADEKNIVQLGELSGSGATNQEIAEHFGINTEMLSRWIIKVPEIRYVVNKNRATFVPDMEQALIKLGLGEFQEIEIIEMYDEDSGQYIPVKRKTKTILPNTTAILSILKAYQPDLYGNTVRVVNDVDLDTLTTTLKALKTDDNIFEDVNNE